MGLFTKRRVVESFFVNAYGNKQTRGVVTFEIDVKNGELLYKKLFKTPSDPVFAFKYGRLACITYKNRTGSSSDGGVCSYAMAAPGALALASRVSDMGKTYMHGCPHDDDTNTGRLYFVDYYNGEVVAIRAVKKKMTRVLEKYKFEGSSIHPTRQTIPHPHFVGFVPDRSRLFVVDLGLDRIFFFDVSNPEHIFNLDEAHTLEIEPGSGPKKMMFNQAGTKAYVLNELSNTIMVYDYDQLNFTLIQTISTLPPEADANVTSLAGQMIFSEKEEYLIVTNRGDDSIVLMKCDEETGKLTYLDFEDTSANPRDLLIFKDRWLVTTCQKGGILESYELSREKDGLLFDTGFSYNVGEPVTMCKFRAIGEEKKK